MLKLAKALHVLGAVMFFGSILGHVTAGMIPGVQDVPRTALVGRQAIEAATTVLTLPGLALLLLTGAVMIAARRPPGLGPRWLVLHVALGVMIALNAALVLYPLGQELLAVAAQVAAGTHPIERLHALGTREAALGAVNVLLCLAALLIAVIKPRIGKAAS